ncbi:Bacterial Ig-like domain (group 2) [Gimesia alba]|uniref:Bacterial Ig-like domain (Group 2) n=2 Tax=Gimesia alba TaxID=2527973 RepID=A0A517RGB4_9PLAN|nr:Bacterial Ig-like domain (group 2) [Gimesia alba]
MKSIRMTSYCFTFMAGLLALTAAATAADIKQPVTQRFAAPETKETPQFQQHVVPLLGKLGCNGRACHGSFQGKGDFRLSLFGYDFAMDHKQMTAKDVARINLKDPAKSLILQKALEEVDHEGGQRFEPNSWQHRLLSRWIENGAQGVPKDAPKFERLEVTPNAIQFKKEGETVALRAVAVWSDGTKEDVTPLCRYQTNNEQIATISETGVVTAAKPGDTHVVAFYDSGVIPVPVLQPVSDQYGKNYPQIAANTKIDKLVVNKLQKLGMVPAETCDDAEFLRRVSLDLTGTLPAPHEIEAFLNNKSPNKRSEKIDELIESPGYAAWWTTKLCDFTQNNYDDLINVAPIRELPSQHWYDWIKKRVVDNEGYDKIVEGILLATSRESGEDFDQFTKSMNEIYQDKPGKDFADRDHMPYYWARRNFRNPDDRVLGFAYTFLGIRIQCAQCHKHPFDQWTQNDFKEFRGFFSRVTFGVNPESRQEYTAMVEELGADKVRGNQLVRELNKQIKNGKEVPFMEVYVPKARAQRANKNKNKKQKKRRNNRQSPATAKLLGAEVVEINQMDDPRTALMEWLRREDNPYFAKAFVNRVWASYFNRGIIEPADDLNLANPPSNGPLLDYLSREFVRRDFDMKWLHREITNSDTYQRSWKTNKTNELDEVNFSHFIPRRMPAEVLYDAIHQATASDDAINSFKNSIDGRAIGIAASGVRNRATRDKQYALTIFGRSTRESNCDCDRSVDPSLLQTMYIKNDNDVYSAINRSNSSWLFQVGQQLGAVQKPNEQKDRMNDRMDQVKEQARAAKQRVNQLKKQEDKKKQLQQAQKRLRTLTAQLKKMKQLSSRMGKGPARIQTLEKPISADKTEEIITRTYLRSLSRYPTESEKTAARKYLNESQDKMAGVYDLIWAVLNTKEFMLVH